MSSFQFNLIEIDARIAVLRALLAAQLRAERLAQGTVAILQKISIW